MQCFFSCIIMASQTYVYVKNGKKETLALGLILWKEMYGNLILFNLLSVLHGEIYLTFAVDTTGKNVARKRILNRI